MRFKVGIAQISPVLLNRNATLLKAINIIREAGQRQCKLLTFGETFVPAYPLWISQTNGAAFDSPLQKALHAIYLDQAVCIEEGGLAPIQEAAHANRMAIVIGVAERAADRGGHSLFCSSVCISPSGDIASVHRKLVPTYEERLAWASGDGHGLVTHKHVAGSQFTLGVLNCWENWMPLARASLHAQGEDLHVALWPGSASLTTQITPFLAREGRSFVISASSVVYPSDIPHDVPGRDMILADATPGVPLYNGGSCIAAPDGSWVVEPVIGKNCLVVAELDYSMVLRERQNFDSAGHYSRPDVLQLTVDRRRQKAARFIDDDSAGRQ